MDPAYHLPEIWQSRPPHLAPGFPDFSIQDLTSEQKPLNHARKITRVTDQDSVQCVSTTNGGARGNSNAVVIARSIMR